MGLTEMVFMLQAQRQLKFLPRHITFQYKQQPLDFPGDFPGDGNLIGSFRDWLLRQSMCRQANHK